MTAQQSQQRAPHAPARDESASAGGHTPHGTPPMSELLASCAAAAAVSSPPSDAGTSDEEATPARRTRSVRR
ncbi:hypothetical protein [Streptomyces sp. NPDC007063]|uniref:hypothetical protein n=1 Tax=Streptomyces sp. NPDC007063 TaxID=3364772 RepID=UPI0036AEDAA7